MKDPHFSEAILRWYAENGRDLPWRRTRDPYAIWLSEIILQQTRIVQGTAYWERFMSRFPNVESLAEASEDEVLRLWEGLGYYSRARNLHAAAKQIVAAGSFPHTIAGIRALKGVGDYTAAAIGSIAFGLHAAVLDGNVYRVLSRYYGIATPIGTAAAKKEFSSLAEQLLPEGKAADFNQGMMDFGAIQCTPASPCCETCPLAASCQARLSGRIPLLPVRKEQKPATVRFFNYFYFRCSGLTAFRKRPSGDIWQGLWEPYLLEYSNQKETEVLPAWIRDLSPILLRKGVRHQLTHRTLLTDFYLVESSVRPSLPHGYEWIKEEDLDRLGKPRLVEILLECLAEKR